MKRLVFVLFAANLVACGPSVSTLVSHKQYREAICAGRDKESVSRALLEDTNAFVHLYALTESEIASVLPDSRTAAEVSSRARLVRLTLETNRIPVDGMRVSVTTSPAILVWPSLATFSELTGETLPPLERRTTEPSIVGNTLAVILTAGLWLLTDPFTPREYYTAPPPEAYRQAAPNAYALQQATSAEYACESSRPAATGGEPVGLTCTTYFLLMRPVAREIVLHFSFEYAALRETSDPNSERREGAPCHAKSTVRVPIGTEADLPRWTRATFGTKPRRLAELVR